MEWKIYEEWLDITLYRQMTNLIYKLSSNEEKYKIYMQLKENDMFLEKPKVDMETAYGLHYPGEVLERIGEHLTWTKRTYRALGLAWRGCCLYRRPVCSMELKRTCFGKR